MQNYFGQLFLLLLSILFLISLKRHKRFWIIFFTIIKKCWFPIFTFLLAIFIFAGTAQGINIINEVEFFRSGSRKYTTIIALWLWAYNCYKLSSTSLSLVDHKIVFGNNQRLINKVGSFVPALFGYIPWIVSALVLLLVKEQPDYRLLALLLVGFWFFILYLVIRRNKPLTIMQVTIPVKVINLLTLYLFYFYRKVMTHFNLWVDKILGRHERNLKAVEYSKMDFKAHWRTNMNGEQIINWSAHTILYILIGVWPIVFSKYFGCIGLILIALSFFIVLGTIFLYLKVRTGFPMFPVMLVVIAIFSSLSDNNRSGYIEPNDNDKRESLEGNFKKWVTERALKNDTVKVTMVAAEGGGLRSAYWTYSVLRKLQLENKDFYKQLYAISCVSGGSIGSALFCAEQNNNLKDDLKKTAIINDDNLSPMVAALFFRELVQSLIPVDLVSLDRSVVMDNTFKKHWQDKHPRNTIWNDDFLELWKHNTNIPAMFVNSIHVESGTSVVLSNLKFDSTQIKSIDMLHLLNKSFSLSQVAGFSSRFAFLQPAAKFEYPDGKTWGHLADGGYYENTGLATLYQVYLKLRAEAENIVVNEKKPVIMFSLMLISNGEASRNEKPLMFLHELNTPINTVLNSTYTRGYTYAHIINLTMDKINKNDHFFDIRLNRKKYTIPLGWFLSEKSRQEIIRQSEDLENNEEYKRYKKFALN